MNQRDRGIRLALLLGSVAALISFCNSFQNIFLLNAVCVTHSKSTTITINPQVDEASKANITAFIVNVSDNAMKQDISLHNDSSDSSFGLQLCQRVQLNEGIWQSVTLDGPPYVSRTKHLRCPMPDYDWENPGSWQSWDWNPKDQSCYFSPWNATEFCDLLPFATVSIIGDSLSWEQYSSLVQLVGGKVHQSDQHASRLEERNIVTAACRQNQRATKFVFRNDAALTPQAVTKSIAKDFPVVLILNRGAHYVNDTELIAELNQLLPVLSNWQATCARRRERKCHLFWRTTVPGHVQCESFHTPVKNLSIMEMYIESQDSYDNASIWEYHWQDFRRQNRLVLQLLQDYSSATGLQYEVLDAYQLNILRPDNHRWHQQDCLHSCYPGKMDVYNQLLLHFLKIQRFPVDSQRLIQDFEQYRASRSSTTHAQMNDSEESKSM